MKKQLLALALAAMTTLAGIAQESVAFVAGTATYSGTGTQQKITGNVAGNSYTQDNIKIEFVKNNNNTSNVNGALFRWYANDEIIVTPLNGAVVTSVSFLQVGTSYTSTSLTCGSTSLASGTTRTWTGKSANSLTFKAGAQIRFGVLEVSYKMSAPAAVAKPEITVTEGEESYSVAISCETEGAEIYYTLDGTEPTAASDKYTAPFELWGGNYTVMAVAIKGEDKSLTASQTVAVPMVLDDFSGLAGADEDMLNEMGGEVKFIVKGKMTYVWQGNNNLYLTDGTYNLKLFGYDQPTYAAGDTFTKLEGTYSYRYGQPQVSNFTLSAAVAGTNVIKPVEIESAAEIAANADNHWYTIKGVEIKSVSGKNATLVDAEGNTAALYNDLGCEGFVAGTNLTVTGFVGLYNTNVQFLPTSIVNEAGEEVVAAPVFNLEDGAYTEGTEIVISCATEGATIHYAVNGGDMESAASPVVLTLTEEMSIEAFAEKEGLGDSEIVTASYTIKAEEPIEGTTAVFDFTSADAFGKIETSVVYPASGKNTPVNDVEMNVNGVSFVPSKAQGGTNPAIYYNGFALRMYKKNTMTFTIQPGYIINKITFTYPSGYPLTMEGVTDGVWTRPEVATQAEDNGAVVLTVSDTANGRIASIAVDFEKIDTGIEAVEVEEGAAAVYYNLQGVRVENPSNGLYIRVAGNSASKVFVR
ncbi:MAG: chitobiase/beta-hexosaminidase C-terminal domain-containing protein [Muribaculaceae bacterium]|nr:chitobiase/beta-hexosaminidase C-terminal domain-containing protein [Muribaculaceae bacterium]